MKAQTFWLMAIICGFAVANLYYNQPILAEIAQSFHASPAQIGWIPTFLGASLGSVVGSYGWNIGQWRGVCAAGLILIGVAVIRFLLPNFSYKN